METTVTSPPSGDKDSNSKDQVLCPKCGSKTILRTARRGRNAGNQFYGCSQYPNCKGIVDVKSNSREEGLNDDRNQYQNPNLRNSAETQKPLIEFPRVVSARSPLKNYQAKHFQSISLPSRYVDGVYFQEVKRSSIRSFAHWRLDFPISGLGLNKTLAPVISVCESLLNRGSISFCTPGIEEISSDVHLNEISINSLINSESSYLSVPNLLDAGESEEEKIFLEIIKNQMTSMNLSGWSVLPQVQFSAINPNIDTNTRSRCDFFITHPFHGAMIVEIDGAQHLSSGATDENREELLAEAGFKTVRIPASEIQNRNGPNLDKFLEIFTRGHDNSIGESKDIEILRLSRLSHQIQVTLLEMIKGGWITEGSNSKIGFLGPKDLNSSKSKKWVSQALYDFQKMFDSCANLLGINHQINPISIEQITSKSNDFTAYILPADKSFNEDLAHQNIPKFFFSDITLPFEVSAPVTSSPPSSSSEPQIEDALWFLQYIFRKNEFWEGQWEVIQRTFSRKDSVVLLPTGAGKSIAFQLSSLLLPGRCIVVDPIIALIDDQIDNLKKVGIDRCIGISRKLDYSSREGVLSNFSAGQYLFCYVAPERFQTTPFRESLRSLTVSNPISTISIDEAHCVSEWGHDFRTAYLNIARTARKYCASGSSIPPIIALTGTASKIVLKDVQRELGIEDFESIITPKSFDRTELNYDVLTCRSEEKQSRLRGFVERIPSDFGISRDQMFVPNGNQTFAGMIFCPHAGGPFGIHQQADFLSSALGTEVAVYAGSPPKNTNPDQWDQIKDLHAKRFKRNEVPIIACTKAFGMGIDKPNVRYTVHIGIPQSIESFYQEAGRAGRDRQKAHCAIILSNDYPDRTNHLLDPSTSIIEIADIISGTNWNDNDDVTRALYFHQNTFSGIELELEQLREVVKELQPSRNRTRIKTVCGANSNLDFKSYEKAIHRLVVLGVIEDYTIEYNSLEFDMILSGFSNEEIAQSFGRYIGAYQSRLGRDFESKANALSSSSNTDYIVAVAKLLIEFIYDHIEQSRRASLREMLNATSRAEFRGENLRDSILNYLEHAEFDADINRLLQSNNGGLNEISNILNDLAHPQDAVALRGVTAQFIASYPDVPSLHLLRGLAEALDSNAEARVVEESILAFIRFSIDRYNLRYDEISKALFECLSLEVLSDRWKIGIAQIAASEASENPDLLRAFIKNFPMHESTYPAIALIASYNKRLQPMIERE